VTHFADNELTRARRGMAWRRWTRVVTTVATGAVLVSLAARIGSGAAAAVALFVVLAIGAAILQAAADGRRWRRALRFARSQAARPRRER